jgi:hypothetical protein
MCRDIQPRHFPLWQMRNEFIDGNMYGFVTAAAPISAPLRLIMPKSRVLLNQS